MAILAIIAGVEDINQLAEYQFRAKSSELAGLSAAQLCKGDCKVCAGGRHGRRAGRCGAPVAGWESPARAGGGGLC